METKRTFYLSGKKSDRAILTYQIDIAIAKSKYAKVKAELQIYFEILSEKQNKYMQT